MIVVRNINIQLIINISIGDRDVIIVTDIAVVTNNYQYHYLRFSRQLVG